MLNHDGMGLYPP